MDSVNSKVIKFFINNNIIKEEDKELYEYALSITVSALIHIITIVVLGITFGLVAESIIFYVCFIAIRKFAGGYHAKTAGRCYISSVVLSVLFLIVLKILINNINNVIIIAIFVITLFSVGCIYIFAPLDTENNPLTNKEKSIYGKIARIIALFMFLLFLIFAFFNLHNIALPLSFGIFMSALVLLLRKIQIIFTENK